MPVSYNGQYIIPAPFVRIEKDYIKSGQGTQIGANFGITLTGKLVPCKGSPSNSGVFVTTSGYPVDETTGDRFGSLLNKQDALRRLFADPGKKLLIDSWYNAGAISCFPIAARLQFAEGTWYDFIDYIITLDVPYLSGIYANGEDMVVSGDYFLDSSGNHLLLSDASEDWQLEPNDSYEGLSQRLTYTLTHSLKAVGKASYNADGYVVDGWQQAKKWVDTKLGVDYNIVRTSGMLNLPAYYVVRNYVRTASVDELGGAYSLTENWILASGSTTEEFEVSVKKSTENNLDTVSVQGNVIGLEDRGSGYFDVTTSKWTNALSRWNYLYGSGYPNNQIYLDTLTYAGVNWLNPTPINTSIGRNPILGSITYAFDYDTRPTNVISGSLYESIQIRDTNSVPVIASIPVLGRAAGPVLQDMSTITEKKRNLTVEVVMPIYSGLNTVSSGSMFDLINASPKSSVDTIILACYTALSGAYSQVYNQLDNEEWSPYTGRYSRNVEWIYQ